ncbi:MAG: methyl-accepting chemotaxis protein [Ruminococcus sp.]|jgi:methyl-accepting chemotaxis protein|nr:methyl-accepting chemotaxis protein [Ruminococcus sp.]
MKLSFKLLIPITVLSILSLLIVGTVSEQMAEQEVMNRFESELDTILSSTANQFENNNKTTEQVLATFGNKNVALAHSVSALVAAEVSAGTHPVNDWAYWQDVADKIGVTEICIIDANGIITGGNIEAYDGFDMNSGDQSKVFMAIASDPSLEIVQDPMPNSSTGKMMQYIGVWRQDQAGVIQVGLGAEIVDQLNVLFSKQTASEKLSFGEAGFVTVVDKDGNFVTNADAGKVGEKADSWAAEAIADEGTLVNIEIEKVPYFAKTTVEDNGEYIIAAIPKDEVMGGINNIITTMYIVIAVTAVITVAIITAMMEIFAVRPINVLIKRMHALADGNFHEADNHTFSGEFKDLSDSIDKFTTSVSEYINEISFVLGEMADGNYNIKVKGEYIGDFAPIRTGFEKIVKEINDVMKRIREAAISVSKSSDELSRSSQELASYATSQSENAAGITSGVDSVNADTTKSSAFMNEALQSSENASELMNRALTLMNSLSESMSSIKTSSENIMHVTNTVDSIAFQTNILALNASVEAARAGANGKGFAVVAQEVRNLATKSSDAVKETTALIDESVRQIGDGDAIVTKVHDSFESTMSAFNEINEKISRINSLTTGQNEAISDISPRLSSIAESIQRTAAEAQESAARSEELAALASELESLVGRFTLS